MINEVHSFSLSKGAWESSGGHLSCPLFTPMCETDSYLQSRAAAKAEGVSVAVIHCWDSGQNANHFCLPWSACT